jgi:uncharacterized membrane protein YqgA involved in biofilm formation
MPGLGTLVNVIAVIVGGGVGTLAGTRVSERIHASVIKAMGLITITFGLSGALTGLAKLNAHEGALGSYSILVFAGSILAGTVIGELMHLEDAMEKFGTMLSRVFQKLPFLKGTRESDANTPEDVEKNLVEGFMSASLIFCVGALTIIGSIQDGLGSPYTTYLKALLDGTIALFLASTLGAGVILSAVSVFIIQGSVALLAYCAGAIIPDIAIVGIEAVGGALVAGVGWNFLQPEKRLPLGNMLPAIVIAFALCWILG